MEELVRDSKNYKFCECGGYIETEYEWLGENDKGDGMTKHHDVCEVCGRREITLNLDG